MSRQAQEFITIVVIYEEFFQSAFTDYVIYQDLIGSGENNEIENLKLVTPEYGGRAKLYKRSKSGGEG